MSTLNHKVKIAYFSLEIGISMDIPSYSGGLGILAGDHIKSAADLGIPLCGITLLYREGYMKQRLDVNGDQTEEYPRFNPGSLLEKMPVSVKVQLCGRDIKINVWRFIYEGEKTNLVPIYFLDTDIPENKEEDRKITRRLYHGDDRIRIMQEAVLGFGGYELLEVLEELGHHEIMTYHINEGHGAFLTLALRKNKMTDEDVRRHFVFTIHTPVPAGHDVFDRQLVEEVLGDLLPQGLKHDVMNDKLNMTKLALYFSRKANGVSKLNGKVIRKMFPESKEKITHITNGVHHTTWSILASRNLFDIYLPGWRKDPITLLKEARAIPDFAIWNAHKESKRRLLEYANSHKQVGYDKDVLTIAFARRAAAYKRASLIFYDIDRLLEIAEGKIQIIFAGKAHPEDADGKAIIKSVVERTKQLEDRIQITYLANYNIWLGRLLTSGVDVWLNTPIRPNEASGTSGMKAALNGVLNLSILDGWWAEACKDGENGWAIGGREESTNEKDARLLYEILQKKVVPTFYDNHHKWVSMMKKSIVTAADFTAQRMVLDYHNRYYHTTKFPKYDRRKSDSNLLIMR